MILRIFSLFLLAASLFAEENDRLVDLDELTGGHEIITATRRIILPEYSGAYNPSIIRFGEGFLLSFRYSPDFYGQPWTSYIGVVLLNDRLELISEPQLLNTRSKKSKTPSQSEDARLFSYRGKFFLIYNDNIEVNCPSYYDRRDMFIAELLLKDGQFTLTTPLKLIHHEKYYHSLWQKNWVPFEWNKTLFLTYSVSPHEILYPNLINGECYPCYETPAPIDWNLGVLRLSSPPLLVDGEYLSFFHSGTVLATEASWGYDLWHYFMGAYTFSPNPPFTITKYTPQPIIGEGFYTHGSYIKRVIFPGGFAVAGDSIYMAYGKDDSEIWIATIDKEALKKALVPVKKSGE